jgi:hypothetical protein
MQQRHCSSLVAVLLATLVSEARSQALPLIPHPGDRIRIWPIDGPRVGILDSLQTGLIVLRGQAPVALVPGQRIDIAVGLRGHGLEGVGIGFLVGGAIGAAAAKMRSDGSGSMDIGAAVGGLAIGAGILVGSTIIGGIVGKGIKGDRWQRVVSWPPSSDQPNLTPESGVKPVVTLVRIPIRIPL